MHIPRVFLWQLFFILLLGGTFFLVAFIDPFQFKNDSVHTVEMVTTSEASDIPVPIIPSLPTRLLIPAINVDAPIQSVGLSDTGDGGMGIPTNFTDVAWYNEGPVPGTLGSAVIDGHLDGKNVPKAVFFNLSSLEIGDVVYIVDERKSVHKFQVKKVRTYDYDAPTEEVFGGDTDTVRLNLITCAGDWIKDEKLYDKRTVVFTELVSNQ